MAVPVARVAVGTNSAIPIRGMTRAQLGCHDRKRHPSQIRSVEVRIGCSGWQYKHWRDRFYPADLPQVRWFEYYAGRFDTVEINNTFYRLPHASAFSAWRTVAPPAFLYAIKASRFLTHMKKLKDPIEPLDRLFSRARKLGRTLGPVLYQLPPHWTLNVERLEIFLSALPRRRRHAIEFRDPSWYTDRVFALLERRGVALCEHDMEGSATARLGVGPFVYARFHGPRKYRGRYDDRTLERWAEWMAARRADGQPVYAYFNNDMNAQAPRDAVRLRRLLAP
jgi:uncharacterized protein YecE (DUF72 family)